MQLSKLSDERNHLLLMGNLQYFDVREKFFSSLLAVKTINTFSAQETVLRLIAVAWV